MWPSNTIDKLKHQWDLDIINIGQQENICHLYKISKFYKNYPLHAAPKRTNESVLAMQPPQADQPEGGTGNGGQLSSQFGESSNQSWATMTIAVSIFIAVVVILLAVAPVTKYIKFRPLFAQSDVTRSQSGPMRLIGKFHLLSLI